MLNWFNTLKPLLIAEHKDLGDARNIAQHISRIALYEWQGLDCLHPQVRSKAKELIEKCKQRGIDISIASNPFRTVRRQQELYDQGRTKPGNIVTNAKPLESYHSYGLAFDIVFDGPEPYPPVNSWKWKVVGELGESLTLVWGGRFNDLPHFEYHPFTPWEKLKTYFEKL